MATPCTMTATCAAADNKARALRRIEREIDYELGRLEHFLDFQYSVFIAKALDKCTKTSKEANANKVTTIFNALWQMQSAVADVIETYTEIYRAHSAWDTTAFPPPDLQPAKRAGAPRRALAVGPKKQKR